MGRANRWEEDLYLRRIAQDWNGIATLLEQPNVRAQPSTAVALARAEVQLERGGSSACLETLKDLVAGADETPAAGADGSALRSISAHALCCAAAAYEGIADKVLQHGKHMRHGLPKWVLDNRESMPGDSSSPAALSPPTRRLVYRALVAESAVLLRRRSDDALGMDILRAVISRASLSSNLESEFAESAHLILAHYAAVSGDSAAALQVLRRLAMAESASRPARARSLLDLARILLSCAPYPYDAPAAQHNGAAPRTPWEEAMLALRHIRCEPAITASAAAVAGEIAGTLPDEAAVGVLARFCRRALVRDAARTIRRAAALETHELAGRAAFAAAAEAAEAAAAAAAAEPSAEDTAGAKGAAARSAAPDAGRAWKGPGAPRLILAIAHTLAGNADRARRAFAAAARGGARAASSVADAVAAAAATATDTPLVPVDGAAKSADPMASLRAVQLGKLQGAPIDTIRAIREAVAAAHAAVHSLPLEPRPRCALAAALLAARDAHGAAVAALEALERGAGEPAWRFLHAAAAAGGCGRDDAEAIAARVALAASRVYPDAAWPHAVRIPADEDDLAAAVERIQLAKETGAASQTGRLTSDAAAGGARAAGMRSSSNGAAEEEEVAVVDGSNIREVLGDESDNAVPAEPPAPRDELHAHVAAALACAAAAGGRGADEAWAAAARLLRALGRDDDARAAAEQAGPGSEGAILRAELAPTTVEAQAALDSETDAGSLVLLAQLAGADSGDAAQMMAGGSAGAEEVSGVNTDDIAEHLLYAALRADPGYHRAWFELGALMERRGDRERAAEAFACAAELEQSALPVPLRDILLDTGILF